MERYIIGKNEESKEIAIKTKVGIKKTGDYVKRIEIGSNFKTFLKREWIIQEKKDTKITEIETEPVEIEDDIMLKTKKELIAMATEMNIDVDNREKKQDIAEKIKKNNKKSFFGAIKKDESEQSSRE